MRVLMFPVHALRLAVGLVRDPRVPRGAKLGLLGAGLYLFSPIDLLPEALLGKIGYLDDGVVLLRVLRRLLCDSDEFVARAHWHGHPDDLVKLRRIVARGDDAVAVGLRACKDAIFGSPSSVHP
jgi:uncharacterized membrane protein YkvA (DUF1232 family)